MRTRIGVGISSAPLVSAETELLPNQDRESQSWLRVTAQLVPTLRQLSWRGSVVDIRHTRCRAIAVTVKAIMFGPMQGAIGREREMLKLRETWEKSHPSTQGNAGWQASFHSSVGDHHMKLKQ